MKKRRPEECFHDLGRLRGAGYEIRILTPYHWHVNKKGFKRVVNVWPTVSKYQPRDGVNTEYYTDVVQAVNKYFRNITEVLETEEKDQDQLKAIEETQYFRENIGEIINKNMKRNER